MAAITSTETFSERLVLTLRSGERIEVNVSRAPGSPVMLEVATDQEVETLSDSGKIFREVHVCGPIGVGKSTLLESFRRHDWRVEQETIPMHALQEYISPGSSGCVRPPVNSIAWGFQLIMMDRAIQRSQRHGVIERPWYENRVFAWANYATGQLTEAEYSEYTMWIGLLLSGLGKTMRVPDATALLLWASEDVCVDRIGLRNRNGEEAYKPAYKEYLAHAYFMLALQSRLYTKVSNIPFLHVLDWSVYGDCTSDSVRSALSTSPRNTMEFVGNDVSDPTAPTLDLDQYFAHIDTHHPEAIALRNQTMEWLGTRRYPGSAPIQVIATPHNATRLAIFFLDTAPPPSAPQQQ